MNIIHIDDLNRNIVQAKAVITMIQLAADNEHSTVDLDLVSDALWSVMDNLRAIDNALAS